MNVEVTMASGDLDEWTDVADCIDDRGSLVVLDHIEGDEVSSKMKTMILSTAPDVKGEEFQVLAVYAPGMWIKVEYTDGRS